MKKNNTNKDKQENKTSNLYEKRGQHHFLLLK